MKLLFKTELCCNLLIALMIFSSEAISQPNLQSTEVVLVEQGDSLFRIALENRPDQTVSIQQTMVAIQQLNPNSFVDGNINRVKAGELLILPNIAEIRSIALDEAINEIREQNQDIGDSLRINSLDEPGSGQLSVLVPEAESPPRGSELSPLERENAQLDERLAELENLVALSLEEEDRARLRREELVFRLTELNAEIADVKELIRLQDLQLVQLRAELAEANIQVTNREIPVSENVTLEINLEENQSYMGQVGGRLVGFFQSNSPLVTIAAPLALFLLGWLLWWDRANYAESEMLSANLAEPEPDQSDIPTESKQDLAGSYEPERLPPERTQNVTLEDDGILDNQEDLTQGGDDDEIEFIANPSGDNNFEDLTFLSEEERERLDSPDAIEEIFYLGNDEESATKLELAYAYQKMGDFEGAKEILLEVSQEGNSEQKKEADELISQIETPNIHK